MRAPKGRDDALAEPTALFLGSLAALAETGDLERRAHNRAFADFDLEWIWDPDAFVHLSRGPTGPRRIAHYALDAGCRVDARAVHAAAMGHLADLVGRQGLAPRPGVLDTVRAAKDRGLAVVLATTAEPDKVDVVLDALDRVIDPEAFAWIGDATRAARPKPMPDIYFAAMGRLDLAPHQVLAVETSPEDAAAALDAGCAVLAFPDAVHVERDFQAGVLTTDRLRPCLLEMGVERSVRARTAAE
ncbi:HAD family hydrolase [Jannaschia sp. LMIT008]|uniref:HAD family hydrolase n=1 Tax=Jannaschia maritima TaxID=3032585 RepID=UPI0028126E2C|nr:HAD family hydrolase [Jannaschia sp. LMIT008]